MLKINGLTFQYQDMQMRFDLDLEAGECMALVGPSGGGKTTLLNLIAGFEAPLSGEILFNQTSLNGLAPQERPVSMLFQDHNLFPHLTAEQNVGLGLDPGLKLNADQRREVGEALIKVGLEDMGNRKPAQMSGGQRQRVAIARALVRRQPILLLDEPFSALDPGRRGRMLDLIDQLRKEQNTTVLMASHNPEDAVRIAEKCAFIQEGRIIACAAPEEVLTPDQDPAIRDYLG